jgi:hypothetical protein
VTQQRDRGIKEIELEQEYKGKGKCKKERSKLGEVKRKF